jgi:hypothetical protein
MRPPFFVLPLLGLVFFGQGLAAWAQSSVREKRGPSNFATEFLTDPALLREEPRVIPRPSPQDPVSSTPAPASSTEEAQSSEPVPTPTPAATRPIRWREMEDADGRRLRVAVDGDEEIRVQTGVLQSELPRDSGAMTARRVRESNVAITMPSGSGLFVGTEIPFPTDYSPARVSAGWGSGTTVVPSTPTRFGSRETGVHFGPGGFRQTEFEGFIDYGSPIRTIAPVFDAEGRPAGFQIIETPNRILQPVFRTIEIR